MGKSTSAQLLARSHGYVYYEADCFGGLKNPFVPLDVDDPSMAQMQQKVLKGPGMRERQAMMGGVRDVWSDMLQGKPYDRDLFAEFYRLLAGDILSQKKRIGGDWAVAMVLMTAEIRALLRSVLGPDLIILVLSMTSEERRSRVLLRHDGDLSAADKMDVGGAVRQITL